MTTLTADLLARDLEEQATLAARLVVGETKLSRLPATDPRYVAGFDLWTELLRLYQLVTLRLRAAGFAEARS